MAQLSGSLKNYLVLMELSLSGVWGGVLMMIIVIVIVTMVMIMMAVVMIG